MTHYGLWGFFAMVLFVINPGLHLWGFMGMYGKTAGDINPHKSEPGFIINE